MAFSNILDTITKPCTGLFSSPPNDTVPFSPVPGDVIPLFFSFLDESSKANLGTVCKTLNATYLKNITLVGLGSREFYASLKDAVVGLMEATKKRPLTEREANSMSLPPITYSSYIDQAHLIFKAEKELDNFYSHFTESLKALNITPSPESCRHFAGLANQIIRSTFKKKNINQAKLGSVTQRFEQKYFVGLCAFYGKQPLENISIDSFKAAVASMRESFRSLKSIEIEKALREAITAAHDSTIFDNIGAELLNPAADAPRFVGIRAGIEAKLIAEKNAPETGQQRQEAIEASLQPAALDTAARNEVKKIANFYRELKEIVGDDNKVARSNALHAIIG